MTKSYDVPKNIVHRIVYATLPCGAGAAVIVNDDLVYTEDDDSGCSNQSCAAVIVFRRLCDILPDAEVKVLQLPWGATLAESAWTFDDVLDCVMSQIGNAD